VQGYIHSIESLAAVDGEGVRCAVFLSGCPLRCVYCHNPDTWQHGGTPTEGEALVKKVARFKPYFGDRGGITFSGGEPLIQASFIASVVPLLRKESISYILDTSGAVPLSEDVKAAVNGASSVLLDLKFPDEESYQKYTHSSIKLPLSFLAYLEQVGKPAVIRTVIVPGINDSEEWLDRYLAVLSNYSCVTKYELLGFHCLGFHKYEKLGVANPLIHTSAMDPERLSALQEYVNAKKEANE